MVQIVDCFGFDIQIAEKAEIKWLLQMVFLVSLELLNKHLEVDAARYTCLFMYPRKR